MCVCRSVQADSRSEPVGGSEEAGTVTAWLCTGTVSHFL